MALLMLAVVAPTTVSADYHSACRPVVGPEPTMNEHLSPAHANVEMHVNPNDPSEIIFRGFVHCPGAVVTITELSVRELHDDGPPTPVALATTGPCHSTLTQSCVAWGFIPAEEGTYRLQMRYAVDDLDTDGLDFENVPRGATYVYTGVGTPVPICVAVFDSNACVPGV